ncbi:hypothetical protein V502_01352 [Pseudogymnoascus sp. VKM F-4520 (FW-2644)]|nr:hypothetical protein V502_01352 [Pseudogymnoascus sp. VKM F-4520 (FW-2644)]
MSLQQLSKLLPLPDEDLQQILAYASTLPPQEAVEHFNNLLGESSASIEFISTFNSRRQPAPSSSAPSYANTANNQASSSSSSAVPKSTRAPKKKKAQIHTPAPRQVQDTSYAGQGKAYQKKGNDAYVPPRTGQSQQHNNLSLRDPPKKTQTPPPRPPPSAAGRLISDPLKSSSAPTTRTSSPARPSTRPTKISITGGTPMSSASANLSELDALIYSLENASTSAVSNASRACNCIATKHALLAAAPNCLNCGKVICVKEGFGPCTFCGQPILRPEDRDNIVRELRADRAQEKQAIDRAAHRRVDTAKNPYVSRAAAVPAGPTPAELSRGDGEGLSAAEKANAHRDRLLGFQAQNASRTRVYDEAADFATPDVGVSQWAGPMERARMLKQQQKVLREQEWNAKPEYEKKREMVSLDVVGGKLVKTYKRVDVKYHDTVEDKENIDEGEGIDTGGHEQADARTSGGAYSRNPLIGGLIRPVFTPPEGKGVEDGEGQARKKTWRRVQDDYEDNEEVILDGGVYGSSSMLEGDMREGADEKAGT